ncbi:trypsin-like peptidase domain-containing protein [Clavibacter sp. VKM Ac-2542]|uniref:trypsin-like peptidase domain-containing protein n=1 Tax=Clavibacter sp. VKM Ac-2542 TaxID=2783811 RepID=UPI0035BE5C79
MSWNGKTLATATGFLITHQDVHYLITNRHNLAGQHSETRELLSNHGVAPDVVTILHMDNSESLQWIAREERLLDSQGCPLWYEHPHLGMKVDVVALRLTNTTGIGVYGYDLDVPDPEPRLEAGDDGLFVIGFPYDLYYGAAMPIWTRASVASSPLIGYNRLPSYLIDARTRQGQSGSPVVFRPGARLVQMTNGALIGSHPDDFYLAGVYSGRVTGDLDLGIVWSVAALSDIVEGKTRFAESGEILT